MDKRKIKKRVRGSILFAIGYALSPVSWYDDLVVNIPLAYVFAFPFGLINERFFLLFLIIGYWITNVIGFMLMHYGVKDIVLKEKEKYTRKDFIKDVILSVIYTVVVVVIFEIGWAQFPMDYFKR